MNTMICTQNLTRDFRLPNGGSLRAVDHLDLEIPQGIVFGFLGPNGSGKTTTIRLLLGLLEPNEGRAEVLGLDTRTQAAAIREQTGALLEHTGLYERITAEDNLNYYGRIYHLSSAERQARIQELLTHMGLWERRKETVGSWSRGMKQKLAVARTLLHRPKLIFLDEPTAGLDPVAAAALREDLAKLVQGGQTTVFLTTHNLVDAERLCKQVAVIRSGRLLAVGTPQDLQSQIARRKGSTQTEISGRNFTPELLAKIRQMGEVVSAFAQDGRLTLETKEGMDLAPVVTQIVLNGGMVEEVRKSKASLEEAFLELVEEKEGEA